MSPYIVPALLVVFAVSAGVAVQSTRPIVNPPIKDASLGAGEDAAGASILGRFRTSLAASIYERADLYLHNGTELRPLSEQEVRTGQKGVGHDKNEKSIEGSEDFVVTSIPAPDRDFRGVLGDLERATGPYRDMHGHKHNHLETTLPLFRLMTWVDPQFIVGWTTGAMIMDDHNGPSSASSLAFLKEGLAANPDSTELMTAIGMQIAFDNKDLVTAHVWFERAKDTGLANWKTLSQDDKAGLEDAYRWLAICDGRLGLLRDLPGVVLDGLSRFPDDQVLLNYAIKLKLPVTLPPGASGTSTLPDFTPQKPDM